MKKRTEPLYKNLECIEKKNQMTNEKTKEHVSRTPIHTKSEILMYV
jgi:hypothetical protein